MNLQELDEALADAEQDLARLEGRRATLAEQAQVALLRAERCLAGKEVVRKGVVLVEAAAEAARRDLRRAFEDVVTDALRSILGPDYSLGIVHEVKRDRATVDFTVASPGHESPSDPVTSRGGGVVDVLSFALRVVMSEFYRPRIAGPMLLDEPFRHLSSDRIAAAARLCRRLAKRFRRQVILVSHEEEVASAADYVVDLGKQERAR